jgi:predicted branched-subunit amino acid permease
VAAAIAVFGIVFGAASSAEVGAAPTLVMSLLVFSGVVQFALVAMLDAGTGPGAGLGAILLTLVALNLRNLVLGAALRPRIDASRLRRALIAWFLVDESFGLSMASRLGAASVLVVSGALCYLAWQGGTWLGVAGAQVVALEPFATAVFPVLFVGLAAITARGRDGAIRAVAAGLIVLVAAVAVPAVRPFVPLVAAVMVAMPGSRD